jgi:hypothetical protein
VIKKKYLSWIRVKTIHKTYRFALLPTKEHEVLLNKHFGCVRQLAKAQRHLSRVHNHIVEKSLENCDIFELKVMIWDLI